MPEQESALLRSPRRESAGWLSKSLGQAFALGLAACALLFPGSAFANACDAAATAPIVHYPFDGHTNDASGNAYHGTSHGGASYIDGICGQAISFDGIDDFVDASGSLSGTYGSYTVSAWIRVASYPPSNSSQTASLLSQRRVSGGGPLPSHHFEWRLVADALTSSWTDALQGEIAVQDPDFRTTQLNRWTHVAMTRIGGSGETWLWVDGQPQDTVVPSVGVPLTTGGSQELLIGALRASGVFGSEESFFAGAIDDFRFYGSVLGPIEIRDLATPPAQTVYREDFEQEAAFPTQPETDLLLVGGMLEYTLPLPVAIGDWSFTGSGIAGTLAAGPRTVFTTYTAAPEERSTATSDVRSRTEFEGFSWQGTGSLSVRTGLGLSTLFGSVTAELEFYFSGNFYQAYVRVYELDPEYNQISSQRIPVGPDFDPTQPWTLDLEIDQSDWKVQAAFEQGNLRTESPALAMNAPRNSMITGMAISIDEGPASLSPGAEIDFEVLSLDVQAYPTMFVPYLNLDLGSHFGVPPSTFGAAGSAGVWNELTQGGPSALLDVEGNPTTVFAQVFADSTVAYTNGAGPLKGDHLLHCSVSDWQVGVGGLDRGSYRVLVYAPADGTPTGPIDINGMAMASLPGEPGTGLTEGLGWEWTPAYVAEDSLVLEEAESGPCTGIAGIQIEKAVPVPETGLLSGLAGGLMAILSRARPRRARARI